MQSTKEKFSLSYPMTQLGEATKLHPYPSGPCLDILLTMIMMILQKSWKVKYNGLKSYLQVARPTALRLESPTHLPMEIWVMCWPLPEGWKSMILYSPQSKSTSPPSPLSSATLNFSPAVARRKVPKSSSHLVTPWPIRRGHHATSWSFGLFLPAPAGQRHLLPGILNLEIVVKPVNIKNSLLKQYAVVSRF